MHNASISVYAGDVGDLITASVVGGVAHPPGYALFTLLGFLITRLHFGSSPAFQVGLISVAAGSLTVALFYLLIKKIIGNRLVAVITSLILAFTYPFWFYNEIAEVFALNSLFAISLTYLAILFSEKRKMSFLYLFFFVLGLSFTNHQTIIFILPSLFILLFQQKWFDSCLSLSKTIFNKTLRLPRLKRDRSGKKYINILKTISMIIFSFALGLTPFLYIPIASSHHPIINWDNVHDLPSFLHLILRKDYGTFDAGAFMKSTFLQRLIILKIYAFILSSQLTIPVVAMSILGIIRLIMLKKYRLLSSFLLAFIISGPLFIFYAGFPLQSNFLLGVYERFFTLSFIYFLLLFPFGLLWFSETISNILDRKIYKMLFQAVFLIITIYLFIYNFPKTDLSHVNSGENFAIDILSPLPSGSILFLSGDTDLFNSRYVEYVKHFREDVVLASINGPVGDSRYQVVLNETMKSANILPTDESATRIVKAFNKNYKIFSINEWQPKNGNNKFTWIPFGLTSQYARDKNDIPTEDEFIHLTEAIWSEFHVLRKDDSIFLARASLSIADLPDIYASALIRAASFFVTAYDDNHMAKIYYEKALAIDPNYEKTYEFLGAYYLTVGQQCGEAAKNFSKAISLNPLDVTPYFLLYTTYKDCLRNDKEAKKVASSFQVVFHEDFQSLYLKQPKSTIISK